MATKCITITDEAYKRLASFKENNESFSDVVNKLTKRSSLWELVGLLSNKEADELEKNIEDTARRMRKEIDETAKLLNAK